MSPIVTLISLMRVSKNVGSVPSRGQALMTRHTSFPSRKSSTGPNKAIMNSMQVRCVQAGFLRMDPLLYEHIAKEIKKALPNVNLHASPEELQYGAQLNNVSIGTMIDRLKEAGLVHSQEHQQRFS